MKKTNKLANLQPLVAACFVALVSLSALEAYAVPIDGLYNTGVGITAGQQDKHYALSKTGGDGLATGAYGYEAPQSAWPLNGPWLDNTATSQWLTPLAAAGTSFDARSNGVYAWTLTFDLTGFDAATASFSGRWAADNTGHAYLNNKEIVGAITPGNNQGFTYWTDFSSTDGLFSAGMNRLDFIVTNSKQNGGNPTGLRVEFLQSNVIPEQVSIELLGNTVPEPGSLALLGLGLVGLGFSRRKQT